MSQWRILDMNTDTNNSSEERIQELKLFNQIMKWEHENKNSKEYTDKQMQERIKKLIQNTIKIEEK